MPDTEPLIVPVAVQAMMVNSADMNFIRGAMNYHRLAAFDDPSPAPFQNDGGSEFASYAANQGIYLMWTLPKALRHGVQNQDGGFTFKSVPNRWLVVRVLRPADVIAAPQTPLAAAWVVESDYHDPTAGSSPY